MQSERKEFDEKPVENIDVLDENGNVTMKRYPRSEVHRLGLWHRVAHVWIVNQKGELIVQKRNNTKESWPNLWDVSSAGHCDAGENSLTTAQRELEEELGLRVSSDKFQLLFSAKMENILKEGTYIDREIVDVYLLEMEVDLSTLALQESEVAAVAYIPYRELMEKYESKDAAYVPRDPNSFYCRTLFDHLRQRTNHSN